MMISSTGSKKIITEFQKRNELFNYVKQLTVVEKKELILKKNDSLKRPSYHL